MPAPATKMPGMAGSHPLDSCGAILSGLAKRLGLESRLVELRLQHRWRHIVGEPTGSHTWPDQIRFKKLYLVVRNSVWLQQLTFLKPTLLEKICAEIGPDVITEIALRVGEIPDRRGGANADTTPSPPASDTVLAEARANAAAVQGPELRARLTQVMAEALSRPDR
jgi:predicted nucleic acid-binding Zn ribbon protein